MDDIMNKSMVVYLITNTVNGKQYVGQTQRVLRARIKEHKKDKHRPIGQALKKYGWKNFTVTILDECETLEQLYEREIYWIAKINTKAPNGYNLTDGGDGTIGHKARRGKSNHSFTDEQRQKMALSVPNRCEVLCVETGEIFISFAAAAKWAGVPFQSVSLAAKDSHRTARGYHWRLITPSAMKSTNKKKAVRCIETGEIFPSIRTAAKWVGVSKSMLSRVIANKRDRRGISDD